MLINKNKTIPLDNLFLLLKKSLINFIYKHSQFLLIKRLKTTSVKLET